MCEPFSYEIIILRCTRKASSALQQKRKAVALTYIRSRKQLEDLLSKRLSSLTILESTFISVEAAVGDIEVRGSFFLFFDAARSSHDYAI